MKTRIAVELVLLVAVAYIVSACAPLQVAERPLCPSIGATAMQTPGGGHVYWLSAEQMEAWLDRMDRLNRGACRLHTSRTFHELSGGAT